MPVGEAVITVRVRVRFIQFYSPSFGPFIYLWRGYFVMEPFSYILHSPRVKINGEYHCNIPLCLSFIVEKLLSYFQVRILFGELKTRFPDV